MKKNSEVGIFKLSIGGWPLWYSVELDTKATSLLYKKMQDGKEAIEFILSPSLDAWARFWSSCKKIGVDKWRKRYEPEYFVTDGTGWTFDIQTPELTYTGGGDNAYPEEFEAFCSAVSHLLGGLEFA
jgi:hypothetical protein